MFKLHKSPLLRAPLLSRRFLATKLERASINFTIQDKIGGLEDILALLRKLKISMTRIESRPSKSKGSLSVAYYRYSRALNQGDYEFFVDFTASPSSVKTALKEIKAHCKQVKVTSAGENDLGSGSVPWFPRKISDLDSFASKVLSYGADLDSDHPGFTDAEYRKRRGGITEAALTHKHGMQLPKVEYTKQEIETWGIVFRKMSDLYKSHSCYEHQYIFPLLQQNCGYREDNIPQISEVSKFLKDCTGWTVRPVMGLLSSRDFLNALAFRVFRKLKNSLTQDSTQYIRHHSAPFYTPEPDICHELLGHAPLFADPDFASFSQEIGLASLGASDVDLEKLAKIYWFTVEFGLCRQADGIKAFGAGLLSSFGELEYCLSDKPTLKEFNCEVMAEQPYPITKFQPVYFVAESFKKMKDEVREYTTKMDRPFAVSYNALTQTIEVLDSKDMLAKYASVIKSDLTRLISAIEKTIK